MRIDVHQHLWTEPFLAALARRRRAPRVTRLGALGWLLRLDGERPHHVDGAADVHARTAQLTADGVDLGIVALSSSLGVEGLPAEESIALIEAYEQGVAELPSAWRAWGAVQLAEPDPDEVDRLLGRGFVGLCLPARAIATPVALDRHGPLLERLERRDAPLFVHPGGVAPAPGGRDRRTPDWWPALTSYVADMNAAWHAFVAHGRRRHPDLRVLFAMLAGGAPLHLERLVARGGPMRAAYGDNLFYDSSSYGPHAVEAIAGYVSIEQIVYGSDRPFADPRRRLLGERDDRAMRERNVQRLLGRVGPRA